MERFILHLGIMSGQAAVVICVVLLVRAIFSRLHVAKKFLNLLWLLPFFVMVFPWKPESSISFWSESGQVRQRTVISDMEAALTELEGVKEKGEPDPLPKPEPIPDILPDVDNAGVVSTGVSGPGSAAGVSVSLDPVADTPENVSSLLNTVGYVWMLGTSFFLIYGVLSCMKLHRRVICSIHVKDNIYRGDDVDTPFVLGVLRPRIYLPSGMQEEHLPYILEHEKTHIRSFDPLKKLLAFVITGIHWFNPLAWTAFYFFGSDMEMACDEETLERLGVEKKKAYAEVLLLLASGKRSALTAPIAFGEGNVKSRIHNMANYEKAWKIATAAAAAVMILLAAGFLTERGNRDSLHGDGMGSFGADDSGISGGTTGGSGADDAGISGMTAGGSGADDSGISGVMSDGPGADDAGISGSAENDTTHPVEKLTMETLIALCEGGKEKLEESMSLLPGENITPMETEEITSSADIISVFKNRVPYSNFMEANKSRLDLTEPYFCFLQYNGKEYRLQISYWNAETADKYGYSAGQLDGIYLTYLAKSDMLMLYSADPHRRPNLDIVSFLEKTYDYDMSAYLTLELPENLYLGEPGVSGSIRSCFLEGNYEEPPHGEDFSKDTYGPGYISVYTLNATASEEDNIIFENGKLKDVIMRANHESRESDYETIEGCQMQAILCEYSFDLFTLPEGDEYQEKNGLTDEEFLSISLAWHWKIYFTEPDSRYLYELSLNRKFFTKDEAIAMARSAVFYFRGQ